MKSLLCLSRLLSVFLFAVLIAHGAGPTADHVTRDIEYGRAGDVSLKLDACTPPGEGPFPVAILIHGGGWASGSKSGSDKPGNGADITPWFKTFTNAGFVWFSIDYRLAPTHRWPTQLDDVQTAIRWVKAHAADYRGDPSRLVLVGHSAGGHLAFQAAVTADDSTRVQAVVGYAPVTDLVSDTERRGGASISLQHLFDITPELTPATRTRLQAVSPITYVRAGLPPMVILHGDLDKTVPIAMTHAFRERMLATDNTCDLILLPGAQHGLLNWEKFLPDYPAQLAAWLHRTLPAR